MIVRIQIVVIALRQLGKEVKLEALDVTWNLNNGVNSEEMTSPQGYAYVYIIKENNGELNFRKIWRRKFKGRTRYKYYDIETKLFIIGTTDRFISIHSLDKESLYKRVDLVIELKKNLLTVTGIWFNSLEKTNIQFL